MSVTPPAEPPRFVLPGSEPVEEAVVDPTATDATTPVDGEAVADDAQAGAQEPAPTDPPAGDYAPGSLEAAIAAVLDAPDDAPAPLEAGNPAPADGEAGSEVSSLSSDPAGSTDATGSDAPAPHPTDDLIDLGDGLVAPRSEVADLLQWAQSLSPEDQAAIEALLNPSAPSPYPSAASGSGSPAPVGPPAGAGYSYPPAGYPGQYPAPGQPGMPIAPAPTPSPVREKLGELADLAPGLAEILEAQQAEVESQRNQIARYQAEQAQAQLAAEREHLSKGIEIGDEQFTTAHPELTPVDLHHIRQSALNSGLMAVQLPKHGGNATEAYKATLETVMWADPKYRDLLVHQQATEIARQRATTAERRENAAALSGNTGSVPRESQSAPALQTPEGRQIGMREYIAAALQSGIPS